MRTPLCQPWSQSKIKTNGNAITCDTLIISCSCNISHSLTCAKTWEKEPKRLKILRIHYSFQVGALFPVEFDPQRKLKQYVHNCKTNFIDVYEIQYDLRLDLPKIVRKWTSMHVKLDCKRKKKELGTELYLAPLSFHAILTKPLPNLPKNLLKRTLTACISTKITKQNKNNWTRNFMWHSYYFMQFQYNPLLNLPKILGKRTRWIKKSKNDHVSKVWPLLLADLNHKAN